jgi:succinyl-diaminopimelate desuccinylase
VVAATGVAGRGGEYQPRRRFRDLEVQDHEDAGVRVGREDDRGVAELFLNGLQVGAGGVGERGRPVPLDLVVDFVGPGYTLERFESDGKPSALLWAGVRPRPELRVIFNAHLDVVPADAAQFEPRTVGDRLYARGAQDMKVSALVLAQVFRELASTLPYALGLQLVADEEVGGSDGTLHQLQTGVTGEFVVIGEHSGLNIVADSKGLVQAILRATGRAAHGAYPWLGDNALMKLVRTVTRLMAHYPPATEEAWRTTVNLARLETPNRAFNQIPADAHGVARHPVSGGG